MAGQKFPEIGLYAVFELAGFNRSMARYFNWTRNIDRITQQTAQKVSQATKGMADDIVRTFSEFTRKSSIVQDAFSNLSSEASLAEMQRMGEAFIELGNKAQVNVGVFDHLVNSGLDFSQAMQVAGGQIAFNVDAFDRLINRGVDADQAFRQIASGATNAGSSVTIMGRSFAATAVALGAVATAFKLSIDLVRKSISEYTELAEATRQLRYQTGILSRESSQYVQAFQAAGLSSTSAARGMTQFLNRVTDLNRDLKSGKENTSDFATAMEFLDVEVTDGAGNLKSTEQLLNEVSDAFQRLGPGVRTAEAAQSLFGIAAYRLLPLLTDQNTSIQDLMDITERYGSSLGALTQKQYSAFTTAQFELRTAMQAVYNHIATRWIPVLTEVYRIVANAISIYLQFIRATSDLKGAQKGLINVLRDWANGLQFLNDNLQIAIDNYRILIALLDPGRAAVYAMRVAMGENAQSAEELADAEEAAAQAGFDLAQAAADVTSSLEDQLKALDKLKTQFAQKMDDINADAAQSWNDILVSRQRDAFDRSL